MIRLLLPLLPHRLAGLMVSTGWGGWRWLAVWLGSHRVMFHLSGRNVFRGVVRKPRLSFLHGRERFPGGVIYLGKVRA